MKYALLFLLIGVLGHSAGAQRLADVNTTQLAGREADSMQVRLQLDSAQLQQVKTIQQAYYDSLQAIPAQFDITARTAAVQQCTLRRDTLLQQVLSSHQWQQHLQWLQERKAATQQAIEERRNRARESRNPS